MSKRMHIGAWGLNPKRERNEVQFGAPVACKQKVMNIGKIAE
jgi:hypothetical protein